MLNKRKTAGSGYYHHIHDSVLARGMEDVIARLDGVVTVVAECKRAERGRGLGLSAAVYWSV